MDYREFAPPNGLADRVKVAWTLAVGDHPSGWTTHTATPDACIEIIRRLSGRSVWEDEQPDAFVAGLITKPAEIRMSSNSRFLGLRLYPWAWEALSNAPVRDFVDSWRGLTEASPGFDMPQSIEAAFERVASFPASENSALGQQILQSTSIAELAERSGRPHRWLQRWFERHVGIPPRTYFRLVRFNDTFTALDGSDETLADHAAAQGFADQSHMAREFRRLSGEPTLAAKERAVGPFLSGRSGPQEADKGAH